MAETTSLRTYLEQLDKLLDANATDEAIHHCRHILQYFPKNVATYRLLGRCLLYNNRWNEAGAVLRRVLSVYPDDYVANVGLSEVYHEQKRGDDAIWHLERAYEHDANNKQVIETLREFYKRYKNVDFPRIHLTTAAVARQHLRNGMYQEAIAALRDTLERMPNRLDLRILLAEALWANDQRLEAAEHALDVLEELPDALEPNRIMAELWLAEERPSDAQRFINRVEAVEPYLALTLVQGEPAPDNAFTLEELDYRRYAETVLATEQPDWLAEISSQDYTPSDESDVRSLTTEVPKEWLTQTDRLKLERPSSLPSAREVLPDIDLSFDDHLDDLEPPEPTVASAARQHHEETPSLANIYRPRDDEEADDDLPDWLTEMQDEATGEESAPPVTDDDAVDPLAWLRESGVEIDEQAERQALMYDEDTELEHSPDNPVAWLEESGIELQEIETPPGREQSPAAGAADGPEEEEDPLVWMQSYEELILDGEDETAAEDRGGAESEAVSDVKLQWVERADETDHEEQAAVSPEVASAWVEPDVEEEDEDNFEWLQDEGLFEELEALDRQDTDTAPAADEPPEAPLEDSTDASEPEQFPWHEDEGLRDELEALEQKSTALTARIGEAPSAEAEPETPDVDQDAIATGALAHNAAEAEAEAQAAGEERPEETPPPEARPRRAARAETYILEDSIPDWGAANKQDEPQPDQGAINLFADDGEAEADLSVQGADTADRREAMSDKDQNETPDWLSGDTEDETGGADDWMQGLSFEEDSAPSLSSERQPENTPDWLADIDPDATPGLIEEADSSETDEPESTEPGDLAWMAATGAEDSAEDEEELADWLQNPPPAQAPVSQPAPEDWIQDFELQEDESGAEEDEAPDWLSSLQPPEATIATTRVLPDEEDGEDSDFEFAWIDNMIEEEESAVGAATREDEQTDVAQSGTAPLPSMLERLDTGNLPQPEEDWESEFQESESAASADVVPDWLKNLDQAALADEEEAADEVALERVVPAQEAPEPAMAAPDWLHDLEVPEEGVAERTATLQPKDDETGSSFDWRDDFEVDDETAADSEAPDWLGAGEDIVSAGDRVAREEIAAAEADEQPEWLVEAMESEAHESEAVAEAPPASMDLPAENAPDWLNAMVPGVDLDYEVSEEPAGVDEIESPTDETPGEEPTEPREFDWLMDIVDEETKPQTEAVGAAQGHNEARFVFSKPPVWLRGKQAAAETSRKEMADWPTDVEDGDFDMPAWLK